MTILGKVSFLACFLATVFGPVALENDGQCDSPQYAEISQEGLIQCVVPSTFTGVVWYNSTDTTHDSQVLRIERQPDGSLRTSGDGVDSGSYTIASNGSLIIPVVTSEHDRNFTVLILDENYEVSQFIVEFITVVYSHQRLPAVNSCEENLVCLELVTWNASLSCVFQYAKPAVNLFWYKFNKGKFENLEATQHSYSEDGFSFSSVVDITISSLRENSLNVFSCRAYGPAIGVEQAGTDVIVFAQSTEIRYDRSCHTEIKKRIVFVDSRLVIPCTDNRLPYAFIWQFTSTNHSEIFMFSTNGKVRLLNDMNMPMEVSTDGSITFPRVEWNVMGIFTCYFLVGDVSYCSKVEIEVEPPRNASASVWIILLSVAVLLVSSLLIISITFYVWRQKNIVPRKTYVKMADAIKDWHFNTIADSKIFKDDAINLLRTVSNEIEENRKKKNIGVIIGSAVGIAAGGITILGTALIPFTFGGSVGLAVAGAAVGAAGAGISIGYSLEKLINDKNRVKLVQPALEAFIYIQKKLAETVVWLSIAYEIAGSNRWRQRLTKEKMKISKSFLREIQALHTGERESFGQMFSKLKTKAKELVNIAIEGEFENEDGPLEITSQWERYLRESSASPFDYLEEAVITILQKQKALHDTPILFTFIKKLYASDTTGTTDVDCQNMEVNTDTANAAGSYCQGGITAGRVTMNVLSLSDDAAKVGANVGKIARGVSVAGVVLSAVGIVVDLVFLGHAVYDLLSTKKEEFSQALLDASDVMVKMNKIASYIYSMQVGTSVPNNTVQSTA